MKNPIIAFLLSFFPGGGLLYLGKLRGIFYLIGIFFIPVFFYIFGYYGELFVLGLILAFLLYFISFVDTIASSSNLLKSQGNTSGETSRSFESERFYTIILSFIPGLGHFQLGLMNRGITFLLAFFGTGIMVFFVTLLLRMEEFLVFGLILPVIWFYSFFDVMNQLTKKQKGEELIDRSILEDFEESRENGRKSKTVAKVLSMIPGVGHLYLGYQKRGFQLLAIFFLAIYLLDFLRLGLFLFVIPILWFYSFFDGLQKASTYEDGKIDDEPVFNYFVNHQKWIGVAFLFIGLYYLAKNTLFPILDPIIRDLYKISIDYWFDQYFQTAIVSLLFIIGGIKLLLGSKKHTPGSEENNRME
ncbi:hypothetical protein [Fervidibacillus halotolerans]|uniref:Multi-TM2 domain-containing protein n=1 Tax=Fervidibacillus halotolerans TaxID=2980027 RepID=A0A9E8RZ70_9BACI|nr:hypothetical protein [Fervidibacillus halotolerans]WAA12884.1 hypothetical protein OE105_01685 [Fervidibacillus halotolerans]